MARVITAEQDPAGILTLTFDDESRSMNVLSNAVIAELRAAIESAASEPAVKGILIRSAKASFIAGADLKELVTAFERKIILIQGYELGRTLSQLFRRIETLGKPVAVAINGAALGGGFELCLACHFRVLSQDPKAVVGCPEVKVGLLPGAGGTQRLPRLIGIAAALPLLAEGTSIKPEQALKLGAVHALAPPEKIVERAREWLLASPAAVQPWDIKGFRIPGGGVGSPTATQAFTVGTALAAKMTQRNYPAPIAILSSVFEGCSVPIDAGLEIESKYFAKLITGPVSHNMIRTLFINKGLADKLARRPEGVPKVPVQKLGVLGAGMMGAGVAYVSALAGIPVVLLDSTKELADTGKGYAAKLLATEVERGRNTPERTAVVLARIETTAVYSDLAGCDLVIEAVFEQRDIKADVTRKSEAVIASNATFASNTSTLPITGLAEASQRPKQFIGIHFFSPVEKMPLVEIIVGKKTSAETIAKALDYVAQIRKTPIVVNDSRGFYTSRVFGTYAAEGAKLLEEGVSPALIENAARAAGMAVGPLAVSDEVTLELQYKVALQWEKDLGAKFVPSVGHEVVKKFVLELKRIGKRGGHGFYEYPQAGKKFLWPGLAQIYPQAATQPSVEEVKRRLLYVQALESARCLNEGVITHAADGDLGSVLGWGFPAYTGGTLSFIETIGLDRFVAECSRMAKRYGPRFKPPHGLKERAVGGRAFYEASPQETVT